MERVIPDIRAFDRSFQLVLILVLMERVIPKKMGIDSLFKKS